MDDIFGNLIARAVDLNHKFNEAIDSKILVIGDNGPNDVTKWGDGGQGVFQGG